MAEDYPTRGFHNGHHDSTARKMADRARTEAGQASKDVAVVAERLDAHLKSCADSSKGVDNQLKNLRNLLWGIMTVLLASLLTALFNGRLP